MRGSYAQPETVTQNPKEAERLKKEIAELTTRKNNIRVEIDNTIADVTKVLDNKYQLLIADMEKNYKAKYVALESRKVELDKREEALATQDRTQSAKAKDIAEANSHLQAEKEQLIISQKEYAATKSGVEEYSKNERERISGIETGLNHKEKLLDEREETLDTRELQLKEQKQVQDGKDAQLAQREKSVSDMEKSQAIEQDRLTALREAVGANIRETSTLKDAAAKEYENAHTLNHEVRAQVIANAKEKTDNEESSASLSAWRDGLNEQDKSQKEKEKFLILKERDIDGKIATLKKLRGE
jgi:hypothetical protein